MSSPLSATTASRANLLTGAERVVVDLGALDLGHPLRPSSDGSIRTSAALGLAAQAEQDKVVAAEQRVLDLRDDRLVEAQDAGEDVVTALQACDQVGADLVLDRARGVAAGLEVAERGNLGRRRCGRRSSEGSYNVGPSAHAEAAARRSGAVGDQESATWGRRRRTHRQGVGRTRRAGLRGTGMASSSRLARAVRPRRSRL